MRVSSAVATAIVALTAVALTGCSSGGSSGGSSSSKPAAANDGAAAAANTVNSGTSASSGTATCKQLTFAQVQPLITDTVISDTAAAITVNGKGQQCEFNAKGTDSTGAITVQVLGGSDGHQTAYAQEVSRRDQACRCRLGLATRRAETLKTAQSTRSKATCSAQSPTVPAT